MDKVICLKWGDKYDSMYVNRLHNGLKNNCTLPFELHCFTEDSRGIDSDVVIHDLPYSDQISSWWNKVWLFSDEVPFEKGERVLYIDLDTLITGNIDVILSDDTSGMVMLRDFYWGIAKTATQSASGLMAWNIDELTHIWHEFKKDSDSAINSVYPHGDQVFISKCLNNEVHYWQDLYPEQVVSFKVHCNSGLPSSASVVCFHGEPSIPDAASNHWKSWKFSGSPQSWVLDYWMQSRS